MCACTFVRETVRIYMRVFDAISSRSLSRSFLLYVVWYVPMCLCLCMCVCVPTNGKIYTKYNNMGNIIKSTTAIHSIGLIRLREQNKMSFSKKKCKTKCENKISTEKFVFNRKTKTIEAHTHAHTYTSFQWKISERFRALKFAKADLSGLLGLNCLLFKMENIIVCVTTIILH